MALDRHFPWQECVEGWRTCASHTKCRSKRGHKIENLRYAGWTLEQYDEALARQRGCCAICGAYEGDGLCADHDHANGHGRGLLCTSCNLGLGNFKDDPVRLRAAANYVERVVLEDAPMHNIQGTEGIVTTVLL